MKVQEELLYYVWKSQYFDANQLTTTESESIKIFSPGIRNAEAGPDFLGASIQIGSITWHGPVEIHVQSSDWKSHKHDKDVLYDNVILHVVWQDDRPLYRQDNTRVPTLCLADKVSPERLERCYLLMNNDNTIPCASQWNQVNDAVKTSMVDRAFFQRLAYKKGLVSQLWEHNKGDWEETTYQLLAYTFGFKANSHSMLVLSKYSPSKIIKLYRNNLQALEALFLGQANLLTLSPNNSHNDSPMDNYQQELIKTYTYVAHKYSLRTPLKGAIDWKFFKVRPNNFPTIRLAQFAQLLNQQPNWFDWLIHTPIETLRTQLAIVQSPYWQNHYTFGNAVKKPIPGIGKPSIDHILINTVVPLLVTYGKIQGETRYIDQAINLLHALPAEENTITRRWKTVGLTVQTAFDSQASIALFNNFCLPKKCLSCHIGGHLLQRMVV